MFRGLSICRRTLPLWKRACPRWGVAYQQVRGACIAGKTCSHKERTAQFIN